MARRTRSDAARFLHDHLDRSSPSSVRSTPTSFIDLWLPATPTRPRHVPLPLHCWPQVTNVVARVRRGWDGFVGPEATPTNDALTAVTVTLSLVAAPLVARRRGGGTSDALVAAVLAGDLAGGAYVNNTRACARWYERQGQGIAQHLVFAVLHVHPAAIAWMDRGAVRDVPRPTWALAHYAYMLGSSAAIQRFRPHRRLLGLVLALGGIALDRAMGPSRTAPWFAWTYYPKLLLGHAGAVLWNDEDLDSAGPSSAE